MGETPAAARSAALNQAPSRVARPLSRAGPTARPRRPGHSTCAAHRLPSRAAHHSAVAQPCRANGSATPPRPLNLRRVPIEQPCRASLRRRSAAVPGQRLGRAAPATQPAPRTDCPAVPRVAQPPLSRAGPTAQPRCPGYSTAPGTDCPVCAAHRSAPSHRLLRPAVASLGCANCSAASSHPPPRRAGRRSAVGAVHSRRRTPTAAKLAQAPGERVGIFLSRSS